MDVSTIVNIILCVLSFILAAISVVTVVITLRQNNKMIEESTRPFISVYTDEINAGNPFFYLVIKNFGKSTAYITNLSMTLTSMDAIKSEMIEIICSNLIMPSWHRVNRESAHLIIRE